MKFVSCTGRNACTEDGTHCRACGRPHEEVNRLRQLTNDVAAFAVEMDYDNMDDFLTYLSAKVAKKIARARNGRND